MGREAALIGSATGLARKVEGREVIVNHFLNVPAGPWEA